MKTSTLALILAGMMVVIGILMINGYGGKTLGSANSDSDRQVKTAPADKIEVMHFHATQQCWSCIKVGEYALKTIEEKFPEEMASGKIVYRDVNGELSENQELVRKYQARGSSLYINAIRDGQDDIKEDLTVWRLVNNEGQFIDYFEGKLSELLDR